MQQSNEQGKLIDAGFDYLTFTETPDATGYLEFKGTALDFLSSLEQNGHTVKELRLNGYEGYKTEETFFGARHDSAIWRTSGSLARNAAEFAKFNRLRPRVRRADLQLTIEQPNRGTGELTAILAEIRGRGVGSATPKPQKLAAFMDASDVTGLTLGARSSTTYLRAYRADIKHRSRFQAPAVRYEVEWKGERGQQIWDAYTCAVDDSVLSSAFVSGEFLARGIMQPLQTNAEPCRLLPIGRKGSDERAVSWIKNSVCKTIERLARAGYADELRPYLLAALSPPPLSRELSGSLEAEIQSIDWELIENAHTRGN